MTAAPDYLDEAYEALRAWCHTRPDRDDPSMIYGAFGSITRIVASLAHIVDVAPDSAGLATGSDDGRSVAEASEGIRSLAQRAACALDDANRAISRAHELVAHLIFTIDDDEEVLASDDGTSQRSMPDECRSVPRIKQPARLNVNESVS